MGQNIQLTASDGHQFDAYRADPDGPPKAGMVLIQEIFGVNDHIRSVCNRYASEGYAVIAPALFDRVEKGVELGYTEEGMGRGRGIRGEISWEDALLDLDASAKALASRCGAER